MALRVVAVAPPELPSGDLGEYTLKSADPASLHNACRVGAERAALGIGAWGSSNWAVPRVERRESVLMMHALREDLPRLEALLCRVRPQLLLIGAMSICMPGAVACARRAKEILGNEVFVVLGGRHASETVYPGTAGVSHHAASPARLMAEGLLPPVFDLVVSGEGELLIAELGELIGRSSRTPQVAELVRELVATPGRWTLAWAEGDVVRDLTSSVAEIDRATLSSPAHVFGVGSRFDVFGGRLTGHVFSDTGSGCVFDCNFCSERRSVTGGLQDLGGGAARLMRQFSEIVDVIAADSPRFGASAFVEDSTLLGGSRQQLRALVDGLASAQFDLRFGAQMTIDQINGRLDLLRDLSDVGLDYLFIGVETLEPSQVGGLNKDRLVVSGQKWIDRAACTVESLRDMGIRSGAAVLFGLGEPQSARLDLLKRLADWRNALESPNPVSLNWATQHPLRGDDGGTAYRYLDWSVPEGPWAEAFRDFGEATVRYPVAGCPPAVLDEVREIADIYRDFFGAGEGSA